MAGRKSVENHKVITVEHDMRVEGLYLSDKKQKTTIVPIDEDSEGLSKRSVIMVHLRSIDDKSYKVTEIRRAGDKDGQDEEPETNVETNLEEDELEAFETQWEKLWNPQITDKDVSRLF